MYERGGSLKVILEPCGASSRCAHGARLLNVFDVSDPAISFSQVRTRVACIPHSKTSAFASRSRFASGRSPDCSAGLRHYDVQRMGPARCGKVRCIRAVI